jgi:DNA-binding MarR family transcriptional regulator
MASGIEPIDLTPFNDLDRTIHSPARLMVMTYLYTVESADYIFLQNLTGLTWGNLSSHLTKLESEGYVAIQKEIVGKKPHSMVHLTDEGREAFRAYKNSMQDVLSDLPD